MHIYGNTYFNDRIASKQGTDPVQTTEQIKWIHIAAGSNPICWMCFTSIHTYICITYIEVYIHYTEMRIKLCETIIFDTSHIGSDAYHPANPNETNIVEKKKHILNGIEISIWISQEF